MSLDTYISDFSAVIGGATMNFGTPQQKFEALAEAWADENPGSSISDYGSVFYHQIIGMGPAAIPILLDRLREGEGQWVYALACISGQQAHTPDMNGDADRVIKAWLDWGDSWGRAHGRISG